MKLKRKKSIKTTSNHLKYSNTIFLNGKSYNIDKLNKHKRTKEFIQDII